jgi:predicted ATPase/DNA-binding winged helix-turn-helix (wHTH) protein
MASPRPPERYRFGPFELQPDKRRLLKDGATISLRPRTFDVLFALVDRAGHLVTKDELLDQVWPKAVVEEAALHVQVSALRKVIGVAAITTVSGRGYQFTVPVTKGNGEVNRASRSKHNLTYRLTSFVGREHEIAQLEELVTANRLVTLTGAGGAGKTRLAIEVASRLTDAFRDGVWLVELAALSDPDLVPQAVAQALEVKEQPARSVLETLTDYLASKKPLLVLDNVEHLLDACVPLIDEILRRCRDVAFLVTSRERLGMAGELTYRVPSLTVPGRGDSFAPDALLAYEGVRLFVERARLLRPDFSVTAENAASLASICYRVDGIPLAIELAAPRLRSMSVVELNERLDQRFALLTDGSRTALPRHRTLRSTIDWSYDLLRAPEKLFLQRLSVFAGGWTLAAADEVCAGEGIEHGDVLDLLTSLADKSLVLPVQGDAQTRYRLLETVRQYARDRLEDSGGSAAARVRHRDYYLALAEEADPKLKTAEQAEWLRRLEEEHENLRAGLEWSLAEAETGGGLRLCGALQRFWWTRGHLTEGRRWCTRVLGKAGAEERTRERAYVLNAAGVLSYHQGDYPAAKAFCEESLAIRRELGDRSGVAGSLGNLGNVAVNQGDHSTARALQEQSLEIYRELGDRFGTANTLNNLGVVALNQGDYPAARALHEESLAISRELGNQHSIALSLSNVGHVALDQGDYPAAKALLEESLAIRRELGDRFGIAASLSNLGYVALNQGDYPAARALLEESLASRRELGDQLGIPASLEGLAAVVASRRDSLRAARIWGATERSRAELGTPLPPNERSGYDRYVSAARIASGDDAAFDNAWQEGRSLTLDQAIELALAKPVEGA